jgi:CRISP-associated protein Cas1
MRRHLNTLFVTTEGAWLNKDGENVVISVDGAERGRLPLHTIGSILGFGRVLMSPPLLGACAEAGIAVSYFSEHGRFLARVEGPVSGNVLLRRWADDAARRNTIIKSVVAGKVLNQRTVVARTLRDHGEGMPEVGRAALTAAADRLGAIVRGLERPMDGEALRGCEGEAGLVYFSVFDHLVLGEKPLFAFAGRTRLSIGTGSSPLIGAQSRPLSSMV